MLSKLQKICQDEDISFGVTWEPDSAGNSINDSFSYIGTKDTFSKKHIERTRE